MFGAGVVVGRATAPGPPQASETPTPRSTVPGSRDAPVARGEGLAVGAWELTIDDVLLDAAAVVRAANQFNPEPPEGEALVLLSVRLRRRPVGPGAVLGSLRPALVTPISRHELDASCGVVGMPLDVRRIVAEGETVAGEWCWTIPVAEVPKLLLEVAGTAGGASYFRVA